MVAELDKFTRALDKKLRPGARVQPTDTFAKGYDRVINSLGFLENVWIGFETLNRGDVDNILTDTFWLLWDQL